MVVDFINIRMFQAKLLGLIFISLTTFIGCTKKEDRFIPSKAGQIVFWKSEDFGNTTVKCSGREQVITHHYFQGLPDCGDEGCATFNLMPGEYQFEASSTNGYTWHGSITVYEGICSKMRLTE